MVCWHIFVLYVIIVYFYLINNRISVKNIIYVNTMPISLETWQYNVREEINKYDPEVEAGTETSILFKIGDYHFFLEWSNGYTSIQYWIPKLYMKKNDITNWHGFIARLKLAYDDREKGNSHEIAEANKGYVRKEKGYGFDAFRSFRERLKNGK